MTTVPQPKPRGALLRDLRKFANGDPGEFWIWWFMLSKEERREVLNQVEAA